MQLREAHGAELDKLRGKAPGNKLTPKGQIPPEAAECSFCGRKKHSCSWAYRQTKVRLVSGSLRYSCTRATALLKTSKSVEAVCSSGVLPIVQRLSSEIQRLTAGTKNKCKGEGRGQFLEATMKLCWNCGAVNASFDQEQFDIHKPGFRGGWQKMQNLK